MLSVGDSVADNTLEESLENTSGLLVDHGTAKHVSTWKKQFEEIIYLIRFTPPLRARRRIAGFVIPWMLSLRILRCLFAPPFPRPLPPFPPAEDALVVVLRKEDATQGREDTYVQS
jgi:hypothetical protein